MAKKIIVTKVKKPTVKKGKIEKVMHEFSEGSLKTSAGKKVTDKSQALAIAINSARKAGAKIPKKKGK